MKTANVNGVEIAYQDEGAGQPLLLVHAFPLSGAMWARQIEELSRRCRVVAPDLRGFGASGLSEGVAGLEQHADDMAALLDHLGLGRVVLGGLSMGGYIAFAFLRRHGERLSGLVLADTRATPDTEEGRQGREKNARMVEEQGPGTLADQMLPKLLSERAPEALRAEVRRLIEANDRRGIAAALRAMAARPDSTPLLASIGVPALVIVGAEDSLTPPGDARAMHQAIPNSRLVEIPGAAHLSNLDAPDIFNRAIEEFLSVTRRQGDKETR